MGTLPRTLVKWEIVSGYLWGHYTLDAGGHDLVIGAAHAEQLQRAHHVEDLGSFHISLPS